LKSSSLRICPERGERETWRETEIQKEGERHIERKIEAGRQRENDRYRE
jgi:hypothetical protein